MRPSVLILIAIAMANLAGVCDAMQVNGVRVFGKTKELSVTEIRHALADFLEDISRSKPSALEVISNREMRVYLQNRDLGWVSMRLMPLAGNPKNLKWIVEDCCGIPEPPDALRIIRAANHVYIFPVENSLKPRRDDRHMRLLDERARKELVHLFGHRSDWEPGLYSVIVLKGEPDVGFVFRHGENEVVLFFCASVAEGTVNGRNIKDLLEAKRQPQFEEWKRRYAQQELPIK